MKSQRTTNVHGIKNINMSLQKKKFSTGHNQLHCAAAATAAKSLQSCLTLWDPIDGSPSGSPVPGIL